MTAVIPLLGGGDTTTTTTTGGGDDDDDDKYGWTEDMSSEVGSLWGGQNPFASVQRRSGWWGTKRSNNPSRQKAGPSTKKTKTDLVDGISDIDLEIDAVDAQTAVDGQLDGIIDFGETWHPDGLRYEGDGGPADTFPYSERNHPAVNVFRQWTSDQKKAFVKAKAAPETE
ncbi:hypothetical protein FALBO_13111 [Fusarium albosuccineum]|uniref:Uncharacterized protein n=1 Tax=Fusarium albosuccineum TaxID=1237068 RepID=A0A8H4KZF0_9HYPO|nr:hypothetical protein FALBO_13111 [Fusarium albosuccineum]